MPSFIAIFRDLVLSDSSLLATEKMALLKRSLSEENIFIKNLYLNPK
jgi:hypothetical protein